LIALSSGNASRGRVFKGAVFSGYLRSILHFAALFIRRSENKSLMLFVQLALL
jgi:hypothetical protein